MDGGLLSTDDQQGALLRAWTVGGHVTAARHRAHTPTVADSRDRWGTSEMIIWGSRGKETIVGGGDFFCPSCRAVRAYARKRIARYFTLYFVPIFETQQLGEYVECEACKIPFKVEVLSLGETAEKELQARQEVSRIVETLSAQLESGLPLNAIAASLKAEGMEEKAVAIVLSVATQGQVKICQVCGVAYKATLTYCSGCGRPLKRVVDS